MDVVDCDVRTDQASQYPPSACPLLLFLFLISLFDSVHGA